MQVIYNIIMALYTIPLGYLIAKTVDKNFKFGSTLI